VVLLEPEPLFDEPEPVEPEPLLEPEPMEPEPLLEEPDPIEPLLSVEESLLFLCFLCLVVPDWSVLLPDCPIVLSEEVPDCPIEPLEDDPLEAPD
jgi:hypothetical protein